jgi:hypothetical protein
MVLETVLKELSTEEEEAKGANTMVAGGGGVGCIWRFHSERVR